MQDAALDRSHDRILRSVDRVRTFLRPREMREDCMDTQSLIMLIISAHRDHVLVLRAAASGEILSYGE